MDTFRKKVLRINSIEDVRPCGNFRHLVSVTAAPNPVGSCTTIIVKIDPNDIDTWYTWTFENTGQIYEISACIDLDMLEYNCAGKVYFTWDDNIDCCN